MHLLSAEQVRLQESPTAVDLQQTPGDIIFLSSADSDLLILSKSIENSNIQSTIRLANLLQLQHSFSVDLYVDQVVRHAKIIVIRLLGGQRYWSYGLEQVHRVAVAHHIRLVVVSGDDNWDDELQPFSSEPISVTRLIWQYFAQGGLNNIVQLTKFVARLIGENQEAIPPVELNKTGLFWPGIDNPNLKQISAQWTNTKQPIIPLVFYRALKQADDLAVIQAFIKNLQDRQLNPLPIFITSLKDPQVAAYVRHILEQVRPAIIINFTGFAVGNGDDQSNDALRLTNCPILQVILSSTTQSFWQQQKNGLLSRDLVMQVVLPEMDGRLLTRVVSFKESGPRNHKTQYQPVMHQPVEERVRFVVEQVNSLVLLQRTTVEERRVGIILSNYPNRDGRLANGVGLDTPASLIQLIKAMQKRGYFIKNSPNDVAELMNRFLQGPTNFNPHRPASIQLSERDYQQFFQKLPISLQNQVIERWGHYSKDPFFDKGHFNLSVIACGNIVIGLQPMRRLVDSNQDALDDEKSIYHDPLLPPPHNYLAFYMWLRKIFQIHAIIHFGKHGNLEWLPGKSIGLSSECFPEAILGPIPHFYPFIVNNPGEGSQAKRRTSAVIIDHLTPPLTRADNHGALLDIERLLDEYYQAIHFDPKRASFLLKQIQAQAERAGIIADEQIDLKNQFGLLSALDRYVCEVKERQIRHGLHVIGQELTQIKIANFLLSVGRLPRRQGHGSDASIIHAIADDLGLLSDHFDPMKPDYAENWLGKKPIILQQISSETWRNVGDTIERLELLAMHILAGEQKIMPGWHKTKAVVDQLNSDILPKLCMSPEQEINFLLAGLDGFFVPPGPSGAPTRGRVDVLPTGRNFFSVDTRLMPTPSAWHMGWKSATMLLDQHRQQHGDWPRVVALTAWGTANMRTAGEDIAQMLAFLGVKPIWESVSGRITGLELIPLAVLGRPRIDVCLRISGFFRDAFPNQIDLLNQAVLLVAGQVEPLNDNILAAQVQKDHSHLLQQGVDTANARIYAAARIFGPAPGSYGTGLQAPMDDGNWQDKQQLANTFINWGSYAYFGNYQNKHIPTLFRQHLRRTQAIIHNQDNREHDILDSDDYYQFEGGWSLAIELEQGKKVPIWHNDHSNPENPKILSLQQEIGRVIQSRAANPKWLDLIMQHGYKGAFEIAATVDYLVAFAATTGAVQDHHFDKLYQAYIDNKKVINFLEQHNPAALMEIANKFLEARKRQLWHPYSNHADEFLQQLSNRLYTEKKT